MQLQLAFSALLAVLLVTFSSVPQVGAAPLRKRDIGIVTLPLKRVQQRNTNVHPLVRLQQHANRGSRRLARMTGREEPSHDELRASIHKRLIALDDSDALEKRYNRQGINTKGIKGLKLVGPALAGKNTTTTTYTNGGKGTTTGSAGTGNAANGSTAKTSKNRPQNSGAKGTAAGTVPGGVAANGSSASDTVANGTAATDASVSGNTGTASKIAKNRPQAQGAKGKAAKTNNAVVNVNEAAATANAGVSPIEIQAAASGSVTNAGNPTAGDSLGLDIEANDVGYLATVQMGTPPQNFLLLMDSGSADLWVGAENCQSQAGGGCGNHNFLGSQSSSTFQDTQQPFSVTYGTGSVSGDIVNDNINVAGLALANHKFGVATTESVEFSDNSTPFDGLMGLAQSTLSEQKTATPIEALAQNGLVRAAITSYKISRLEDEKNDGEITFGGTDPTKFDPNTVVTLDNVSKLGFWEASMPAVTVDGQDVGLQGRTAILDTGTTLIIAPANDALAVHQQIPGAQSDGQGGFIIPCTTTASVALTFGKTSFAIDPRDLAFAPLDPNDPTGDCVSGISSGNVGGATEWLVGDVFLKNAYFSTNVNANQLSLAKLV